MELSGRIAAVQERIARAARRAGRDPAEVTLVAVSKTHTADEVAAAYAAGLRVFGENRVEEAGPKATAVAELLRQIPEPARSEIARPIVPGAGQSEAIGLSVDHSSFVIRHSSVVAWHMIGHLQTRKAEDVLPWASVVHSVDSVKLAARLSRFAAAGREVAILLEVNVSGEGSKYGFIPAELPAAVEAIAPLPGLRLQGLMTMAPIVPDPADARPVFAGLRRLRDDLAGRFPAVDWRHLSMGMTDDFEVAIEEGATMVRIGRAIFGERL
jgi:pyridoxal phosphate enzyme (YggS family)